MRSIAFISILLGAALTACNAPTHEQKAAQASEVIILPEDEAEYERRFTEFVQQIQAGQNTASYEPSIMIGETIRATPLPRNNTPLLDDAVWNDMVAYAKASNSDALVVLKDGEVRREAYFGDITQGALFNGRSMSKTLGALAVGRAIEAGNIASLDQSASDFIVEWRDTEKGSITIRHILGMRTGLQPQTLVFEASHVINRAYLHPKHTQVIINEYPLTHVPGSRYEYSNANGEIVAALVERATGRPYHEWIETELLAPIAAPGGELWLNREGGTAHSSCCASFPVETWLKLAALMEANGEWSGRRLLPDGFVQDMRTGSDAYPQAGLGLFLGEPYREFRPTGHPDGDMSVSYQSQPFNTSDVFMMDFNKRHAIFFAPNEGVIIARFGIDPPTGEAVHDNAMLMNLALDGMTENPLK